MNDDIYSRPSTTQRRGMGLRSMAAIVAAALLAGAALAAWIGWQGGWLKADNSAHTATTPQQLVGATPSPNASPSSTASTAALDEAGAKLAALENRMAVLNQEASAASGNATQAEALLVAFAARRMIERGQPLGYLENQLRVRFGESQPKAVKQVIDAAANPVTLDELNQELAAIGPELTGSAPDESSWAWFKRQLGELVVIRHQDKPSPAPQKRLERARLFLAGGRVDAAIAEVQRMPGQAVAADWIAKAQRYVATEQALDLLETAAILAPQAPATVNPAPKPLPSPSPSPSPTGRAAKT